MQRTNAGATDTKLDPRRLIHGNSMTRIEMMDSRWAKARITWVFYERKCMWAELQTASLAGKVCMIVVFDALACGIVSIYCTKFWRLDKDGPSEGRR
jgi:hypothetical protein